MKLGIIFISIFYFSSVLLCTKNADNGVLNNSDTTQIVVNNCINLVKNNTNINLCLDSVLDSRCPADVTCVWQGVGIVKMSCTINKQNHQFKLSTTKFNGINADTILQGFQFKLVGLSPFPIQSNPQPYTNYKAKILGSY